MALHGKRDRRRALGYSDGTKVSRPDDTPAAPPLFNDPEWRDSERDADGDGLAN